MKHCDLALGLAEQGAMRASHQTENCLWHRGSTEVTCCRKNPLRIQVKAHKYPGETTNLIGAVLPQAALLDGNHHEATYVYVTIWAEYLHPIRQHTARYSLPKIVG